MKFIPTTVADLEKLKARAKVLKRKLSIKHRQALDKAAQEAKYLHWHHAMLCQKQSQNEALNGSVSFLCESILKDALKGETHYIHSGMAPIVLVADGNKNAFVLDATSDQATLLVLDGEKQAYISTTEAVQWDARYSVDGEQIVLTNPAGRRVEFVIDPDRLDDAMEVAGDGRPSVQVHDPASPESQDLFAHIFGGQGLEPITPESVSLLLAKGFDQASIDEAIAVGASFSRPRISMVYPIVSSDDIDE